MSAQTTLLLDSLRLCATALMVLASGYALSRRDEPLGRAFGWLVGTMTAWATLTLVPGTFAFPSGATLASESAVRLATFTVGAATPVLAFVYVRQFTGHNRYDTLRRRALLLLPVVGIAGLLAVRVTVDAFPSVLSDLFSVLLLVVYVYVGALLLLALYLLARLARRYAQVPGTQVAVVGAGLVAPPVAVIASSLTRPAEGGGTVSILPVDVSVFGFLVAGSAFLYAMRAYPVFTPFPESGYVARDEILADLSEGVVILDMADRILDMNASATRLCGPDAGDAIGRPIDAVLPALAGIGADGVRRVELQTPDGPRRYEVSTSAIRNGDEGPIGRTLLLRDITDQETREQQLQVLTRALRHNLRNDVDAALAYTTEIEDPEVRSPIRSKLTDLAEMGAKAREVENVLSMAHEPRTPVDVAALAHSVADRLRAEYEACTVSVTAPDELVIRSHERLLDRLLTELIENGIEHSGPSDPRVDVTIDRRGETVEIRVEDAGPGVPEYERDIIEDGAESPLEHGSGIGLWLVDWIVDSLGGDLSFGGDDTDGGMVTVRLRSDSHAHAPADGDG